MMNKTKNKNESDRNLFSLDINWEGFRGEVEKLVERSFAAKKRELREQIKRELLNELRGSPEEAQSYSSEDISLLSNGENQDTQEANSDHIVEVLRIDGRANHTTYYVLWSSGKKSWVHAGQTNVPHYLRRRYWNKCRLERERQAKLTSM